MPRRKLDPGWLTAALLPLIGILPTLGSGVIDTADGPLHVQRIYAMGVLLSQGNLWPRWVPWFHLGYGYPVFNFYPPGVFYLGGLLTRIGVTAMAAFTAVAALAWIAGSIGMYGLARRFLPGRAAILAAMLWAYAPSRLFEVWDQGSLPQMLAAAMIPWLLLAILSAASKPTRRSVVAIAVPLAVMILSHQPMTFISALYVGPLALLAPLWAARQDRRSLIRRYAAALGGVALGAGLTAIFLLPLALELRYVSAASGAADTVNTLISNFLKPQTIFMQPPAADLTDLRYELPTTLGLVGGLLAIPGILALIRRRQWLLLAALTGALGLTLVMLVQPSLPIWLAIPYFRQLRFPERFLRMGAVLIALLGGASILLLPRRVQIVGLAAGLLIALVGALPMIYPNQRFLPWHDLTAKDEIDFENTTHTWGTTSYDEFDPIWGQGIPLNDAPEHDDYVTTPTRVVVLRVDMAKYGDILQQEQLDPQSVRVTLQQPFPVRFHQYYFPGWTATLDGQPAPIVPDARFGLITVNTPPGEHVIALAYTGTPEQTAGAWMTLACIVVAFLLLPHPRPASRGERGEDASENRLDADSLSQPHLPRKVALGVGAAVAAFALVNTFVLTPNTLLFRLRSAPDAPAAMQTPVHASFGGLFELLGYTLDRTSAAPGEEIDPLLFWRAQQPIDKQYRPVVKLVDLNVSQAWAVYEPFFPGGGQTVGYPQDRFASEIDPLKLFDSAPPYVGKLMVQMVNAATGEPLRLADGSDHLLLDPLIRINGEGAPLPNKLQASFDDAIALYCATIQRDGDAYAVTLGWHVLAATDKDYVAFIHGLSANGQMMTQIDAPPLGGNYPTSLWLPGQNLTDHYRLPYDASVTRVTIGLYARDSGARLPAMQGGAQAANHEIALDLAPSDRTSCPA